MHCENHCFAFQKYGFYTAKVGVLCSKTPTFATPNGIYRFCINNIYKIKAYFSQNSKQLWHRLNSFVESQNPSKLSTHLIFLRCRHSQK